MSGFSKQDYELINLGVCIKNQADRLDVEHEGVPLEGVVVRIAEAAIAARREAIRLMTAESRAGVVAEEPEWEYGIAYAPGNEEFEGQDLPTIERRVKYIRRQGGYYSRTVRAMRRRPAGDSVPVKQEGTGQ